MPQKKLVCLLHKEINAVCSEKPALYLGWLVKGLQKQQSLKRRLLAQKFLKRKVSLLKKGNELRKLYKVEVYIIVYRYGNYYILPG